MALLGSISLDVFDRSIGAGTNETGFCGGDGSGAERLEHPTGGSMIEETALFKDHATVHLHLQIHTIPCLTVGDGDGDGDGDGGWGWRW